SDTVPCYMLVALWRYLLKGEPEGSRAGGNRVCGVMVRRAAERETAPYRWLRPKGTTSTAREPGSWVCSTMFSAQQYPAAATRSLWALRFLLSSPPARPAAVVSVPAAAEGPKRAEAGDWLLAVAGLGVFSAAGSADFWAG